MTGLQGAGQRKKAWARLGAVFLVGDGRTTICLKYRWVGQSILVVSGIDPGASKIRGERGGDSA